MFLTREEVAALTGRVRRDAQQRALRAMGVEHRVRPDGSVAVLRAHVEQVFGLRPEKAKPAKTQEPNWDAVHGSSR